MVSYIHAHTINPFPRNYHTEQKRMGQRREGKRKRDKILLLVWSRTVTVLVCTYTYTVIIIFFLLEGWLTTLRKLSIKGCVWEGNVPPSARSAKLKVIHGLK